MKQFIVENYPVPQSEIELRGRAYNYLVRVRRHREGNVLDLAFANGEKLSYTLVRVDRVKKILYLKATSPKSRIETSNPKTKVKAPVFDLILLQWMLKPAKMDIVVRQATELGVRYIVPIFGEYSVVQVQKETKQKRYERIIKEARQQSNSPVLTEVLPACRLEDALADLTEDAQFYSSLSRKQSNLQNILTAKKPSFKSKNMIKLYFTEKDIEQKSLISILKEPAGSLVLAVGCEGGISPREYELLKEAKFLACHFQTNILRAETAALYALAVVQTIKNELLYGEF
ncbi:MAG: RsmE family RNA methyltransferase [Treponemataceae bacterium]